MKEPIDVVLWRSNVIQGNGQVAEHLVDCTGHQVQLAWGRKGFQFFISQIQFIHTAFLPFGDEAILVDVVQREDPRDFLCKWNVM